MITENSSLAVDTFGGRVHVEWDPQAAVTPLGQLPFFEDSMRRSFLKMEEEPGIAWLQRHLKTSYLPLLRVPWILDIDTTVKVLYGHQEGAVIGYNPKKPGRPSHT